MTVEELIERLKDYDRTLPVYVVDHSGFVMPLDADLVERVPESGDFIEEDDAVVTGITTPYLRIG